MGPHDLRLLFSVLLCLFFNAHLNYILLRSFDLRVSYRFVAVKCLFAAPLLYMCYKLAGRLILRLFVALLLLEVIYGFCFISYFFDRWYDSGCCSVSLRRSCSFQKFLKLFSTFRIWVRIFRTLIFSLSLVVHILVVPLPCIRTISECQIL